MSSTLSGPEAAQSWRQGWKRMAKGLSTYATNKVTPPKGWRVLRFIWSTVTPPAATDPVSIPVSLRKSESWMSGKWAGSFFYEQDCNIRRIKKDSPYHFTNCVLFGWSWDGEERAWKTVNKYHLEYCQNLAE